MKQCKRCKVDRPLSEFGKSERSVDGHTVWCRLCLIEFIERKNMEKFMHEVGIL